MGVDKCSVFILSSDGYFPDGLLKANMTMSFDCHFAQRSAGRPAQALR